MDALPQMFSVLAVLALMGLVLWWLKNRGVARFAGISGSILDRRKRPGPPLLERADHLQLSPTHSLSLIRMADRAILVGISPSGLSLLESASWKSVERQTEEVPR